MTIVKQNHEIADPIELAEKLSPFEENNEGDKFFRTRTGKTFYINSQGISVETEKVKRHEICSLIEIIAEGCTEDGTNFARQVQFKDTTGRQHVLLIEKGELVTKPSMVLRALVNNGLEVYSITTQGTNKDLIEYLMHCPVTSRFLALPSLGWFRPGEVFVIPQVDGSGKVIGNYSGEMLRYSGRFESAPKCAVSGTLDQWQSTIGINAKYSSRLMFALCLAFASPMLVFSNETTGGFHLVGPSSKGKSTALRALSSVWQEVDPNGNAGMEQWDSTKNGIEAVATAWSDFPLPIDELGNTDERQKKDLQAVIYMLGNGVGKGRQMKTLEARKRAVWRFLFLSTGELTAEELCSSNGVDMAAGASVRLANIQAVPSENAFGIFEKVPEDCSPGTLANSFVENGSKFYGTAGPAFIEALINKTNVIGGFDEMKKIVCNQINEWVVRYATNSHSQVMRVARRFALVSVAGELAIELQILPWCKGEAERAVLKCFRSFMDNFESSDMRQTRLAQRVLDYVEAYPKAFAHFTSQPGSLMGAEDIRSFYGYVFTDKAEIVSKHGQAALVFFNREGFRAVCRHLRKGEHEVVEALREQGMLLTNNGPKSQYKVGRGRPLLGAISSGNYYAVVSREAYAKNVQEALVKNAPNLANKITINLGNS